MRLCWDAHIIRLFRKMIQDVLGDRVRVFDGGNGTAREMKRRLDRKRSADRQHRCRYCGLSKQPDRSAAMKIKYSSVRQLFNKEI